MNDDKKYQPHTGEGQISSETSKELSRQRTAKGKSKQQQYPSEDKRKMARKEHTNGSTPKSRL